MATLSAITKMQPISADSHVTEPPDCFIDRIDPKFREDAPRGVDDPEKGALYLAKGMAPMGIANAAAAGIPPEERAGGKMYRRPFSSMHRGGWDPKARVADMDRDGVALEVIYPTVGMALFYLDDMEYKRACFDAYNRWLQEFVSGAPDRLVGIGLSTAATPEVLIEDMRRIKALGFKGVMIPDQPGVEDYDSPIYDAAWRTAVELDLPLSFHLLFGSKGTAIDFHSSKFRGGKLNRATGLIRMNQDIIGVFVFGGVFDRHPDLKLVSVEADAGWIPHFMRRMDHAYDYHRHNFGSQALKRKPSDYVQDNIYLTFQDDETAFHVTKLLNPERLLWATDFPHSDSIWPFSRQILARQTKGLNSQIVQRIIHENAKELYKLDIN